MFKSMVTRIITAVGFMVVLLIVLFADDVRMRMHGTKAAHTAGQVELVAGIVVIGGLVLLWIVIAPTHVLRELRRLTTQADDIGRGILPNVVRLIQRGQKVESKNIVPRPDNISPDQFGTVHLAIVDLGRRAIDEMVTAYWARQEAHESEQLAAREARVAEIVIGLARRYQGLMKGLLNRSFEVQRMVQEPDLLEALYAIDKDIVQGLRLADHALILGGETVGEVFRKPATIVDVCRAAAQEVSGKLQEVYDRITLNIGAKDVRLHGHAVTNVVHLLAALMDNALRYSPTESPVEVRAGVVGRGLSIAIKDRGLGLTSNLLNEWNSYLRGFSDDIMQVDTRRLGLAVVARLAAHHGITVTLTETAAYGGVTVVVVIPRPMLDGIAEHQIRPSRQAQGLEQDGPKPWEHTPARPGGGRVS